jgi:hypothetical protein
VHADGFEKNETLGGWFWRQLPLPDAATASRKYDELHAELLRWKGPAIEDQRSDLRRRAAWPDVRIQQAGRGIMIWVRDGRFGDWWHERETWSDDPMAGVRAWE